MEVNIPNSRINKRINSYINYSSFEIDSGESLSRVDANIKINKESDYKIRDRINIGNSLKFNLSENNLENIAYTIDYINSVIGKKDIKNKIPRFKPISDKKTLDELNSFLNNELKNGLGNKGNLYQIDLNNYLTNFDVILSDYENFIIKLNDIAETVSSLELENIIDFILTNNPEDDILQNLMISIKDSDDLDFNLKDLIFFDYLDKNIILFEGDWYGYNEDYLEYLKNSLDELESYESINFSFYSKDYFEFIKNKYIDQIDYEYDEFKEKEFKDIKDYFKEDDFNKYLQTKGFINLDKDNEYISNHKIEITDLYKDDTIFAVKIGDTSASLSFVVDQSLMGLKWIHEGKTDKVKREDLHNVCIWLILERNNHIDSVNDLNMIILKNKLDYWKKQVRLLGYNPLIKISYKSKNKNL